MNRDAARTREPLGVGVGAGIGGHVPAPAVLGRVLPGGPTPLPGGPTPLPGGSAPLVGTALPATVFRTRDGTAPARGSVGRLIEMFSPRPPGVSVGAGTERVAPPRMSVAAPAAVMESDAVRAAVADPSGSRTVRPPASDPGGPPPPGLAAPGPAGLPASDGSRPGPSDGPPRTELTRTEPPGTEPAPRWRLTDLDPADLAELADLVLERIEGRVRGELERRGRRGVPGVF